MNKIFENTKAIIRKTYPVRFFQAKAKRLNSRISNIESLIAQEQTQIAEAKFLAEMARDAAAMHHRNRYVGSPIKVLFLVHHPEAWYSVQAVYKEMLAAEDFEPIVASINRLFPGSKEYQDEEFVHDRLESFGVPHLRFRAADSFADLRVLRMINPHIIFRQSQWDKDVPPAFSIWQLLDWRVCQVPYEIINLIENPENGDQVNSAYDTAFHKNAWMIFTPNVDVKEKAKRNVPALAGRQFFPVGHPKIDLLKEWKETPRVSTRFTVLWSAHHSITNDWTSFGTFPTVYTAMIKMAKKHPDWHIIFSAHPALLTMLDDASSTLASANVTSFWEQWNLLPNTSLIKGGAYKDAFVNSDVLISDGLSWLLEYQIMEKPVIFIEREGHAPFNEFGKQILAGLHTISSPDEIEPTIAALKAGALTDVSKEQRSVVAKLFPIQDAAKNILNAIRNKIAEENQQNYPVNQ